MNVICCGLMVGRYRTLARVALVLSYMVLTEKGYGSVVNSLGTAPTISLNILDSRLV